MLTIPSSNSLHSITYHIPGPSGTLACEIRIREMNPKLWVAWLELWDSQAYWSFLFETSLALGLLSV